LFKNKRTLTRKINGMKYGVAIFDDNKNVRDSISLLLETDNEFVVVGTFSSAVNCIEEINTCKPNIILMDIEMPELNGIQAVTQIKAAFPDMLILMQTVFEDDDRVFDSICAGANGYILKSELNNKLIGFIKELAEGGSPMSPSIARKVLNKMQTVIAPPKSNVENYHLTAREKEVLACIVNGLSHKMIADELFITYETVRSHVKNIYEKLHVVSVSQAVYKAMNEKLI
jgi:DNA-binding NarL/FixJ family response regulator